MGLKEIGINTGSLLLDKATDLATNNPIAYKLGINNTDDNLIQFFNRFGKNNSLQDRPASTVISKPYYYNVEMLFHPISSNVMKLLKASLKEVNTNALKYFIQGITVPDIESHLPSDDMATELGMVSNTGLLVKSTTNNLAISFLSTEFSLHEHVFYYWLRETMSNSWNYPERPFTKATLNINFLDSTNNNTIYTYIFSNVFPIGVETMNPSHDNKITTTRSVTFKFDNMYIDTVGKLSQSRLERAFDKYVVDKFDDKISELSKKIPTIPSF